MYIVIEPLEDSFRATQCSVDPATGQVDTTAPDTLSSTQFPTWVAQQDKNRPRWVWADTSVTYDILLAHGVRVARCHDLRLSRAILRQALWVDADALTYQSAVSSDGSTRTAQRGDLEWWDSPTPVRGDTLFDVSGTESPPDAVVELARQMTVLASAGDGHRQRLSFLIALESAGALIAREMHHAGVPWDRAVHEQLLVTQLGERPALGHRPALLERQAQELRRLLDAPDLNPDSPKDLLKALNSAGIPVTTTSKWALREYKHPVLEPLEHYKQLQRLWTAHGWSWLDEWVKDGRYRPVYTPGGVVTGRWGADGGGALQLPHTIREAARADEGWTFVIADAAQLEPRVLAAMSGDASMAQAGQGVDMYQAIADAQVVPSRKHAKFGMLGAMYGGTTGVSAQVLPQFRAAFPHAMSMLEAAARTGEQGGQVTTWLGRTSPAGSFGSPGEGEDADAARERRMRSRGYGRFTRNFIVQGSAAEWAMLWMLEVRNRMRHLTLADPFVGDPQVVFFLHDEILIHTPVELAPTVVAIVHESARRAGEQLFRGSVVEFPVQAVIHHTYSDPKSGADVLVEPPVGEADAEGLEVIPG